VVGIEGHIIRRAPSRSQPKGLRTGTHHFRGVHGI